MIDTRESGIKNLDSVKASSYERVESSLGRKPRKNSVTRSSTPRLPLK
jgi:hypothetical protein